MTSIVFNSVPLEDIDQSWGSNPAHDRVTAVIREIKRYSLSKISVLVYFFKHYSMTFHFRYGVVDVFEPQDLIEMKNIPKVTKCLAQLSKLVS